MPRWRSTSILDRSSDCASSSARTSLSGKSNEPTTTTSGSGRSAASTSAGEVQPPTASETATTPTTALQRRPRELLSEGTRVSYGRDHRRPARRAMSEAIATAPATPGRSRRVRRPSGEPPPLDRPFGRIDRTVILAGLVILTMWIIFAATRGSLVWIVDKVDRNLMRPLIAIRTPALTHVARAIDQLTSGLAIHLIRWATFIALVAVKRFRHLIVYLAALATAAFVSQLLVNVFQRPRPYGIEILGEWDGFAHPSLPIVALTGTLAGICATLVPKGTLRRRAELVCIVVLGLVGLSRVYLATDHPSDVLFA